ncbi:MAG: TlpA disulfide reductase family protein [Limnohabitans sp.]|nr:TlpA disulfide reductase family protein [Limnohabitans sp.]
MKIKQLFTILFLISLNLKAQQIQVSGKIIHNNNNFIHINDTEIKLNSDGTFNSEIKIDYAGQYSLVSDENHMYIYLDNTSKLNITADNSNFSKSINFTGKGSEENNYWKLKRELEAKKIGNPETFYKLNENSYIEKIKELRNEIESLFAKYTFNNEYFTKNEKRSINFQELSFYTIYEYFHSYFTKNESFKTSSNFPKINSDFDLNNEEDYLFSYHYETIVSTIFREELKKHKTSGYLSKSIIPVLKSIKNKHFKQEILNLIQADVNPQNPDGDILLNEIIVLTDNQDQRKEIIDNYNKLKSLLTLKKSPNFNYANYSGGKTSLEDLKGKYVYIDIWATWCVPCIKEIPNLEILEKKYINKNIAFVSISIDEKENINKWKNFIKARKLSGIQLIADAGIESDFIVDYAIKAIPRFILIDPNGDIILPDAPRPSSPDLIAKLTALGL